MTRTALLLLTWVWTSTAWLNASPGAAAGLQAAEAAVPDAAAAAPVLPDDAAHRDPAPPARGDRGRVRDADREWWAFQPLRRVAPPRGPGDVPANPIDAFLRARLRAAGLESNPPADRRRQLRRASFDLLGLPPTPAEMAAWLADEAPGAWERQVDRLLDRPEFGERWARHWLDVARFAESSGFEHDYDRPYAYHYRDFVIRAFNADLPYDRFVRWQIAGDEYEPDNPLALMATGFLGAGVFPTQITANEVERTRYDALDDMLSVTGSAMLGLTIGCARCHDHKYDPIPANDYYRMLATFTTTVRSEVELDLDPERYRREKARFEAEHQPLVEALAAHEREVLPGRFDAWLAAGAPGDSTGGWERPEIESATSRAGARLEPQGDGSFLATGTNADTDVYTFSAVIQPGRYRALRVEALAHPSLVRGGPGRADNGNIGLSRVRVEVAPVEGGAAREVRLVRARATFEQNSTGLSVASALDADPRSGWAVDPKFGADHAAVFEFEEPLRGDGPLRLQVRLEFELNTRHNIGRPRLSLATRADAPLVGDGLPASVARLLADLRNGTLKPAQLSAADRAVLLDWWKGSEPGWRQLADRIEEHQRRQPKPELTKVLVCAEGYPAVRMHTQGADFFPETHHLQRGSTDLKKGVAQAGFLQVLTRTDEARWRQQPPAGVRYSGRRRGLAEWLTDVETGAGHLLARVMVNRLWQHHFGRGLVSTPNDFGTQGTRPSHPELLDWLAGELIAQGWRLKPLHRLILTSDAYRQDSRADAARERIDPENILLSRWTPRRLEAESIRDSLLQVSGQLDPGRFGPGTLDPGSRRRSIYFTVKRSQMIGALQAFDAPEPLVSQGTRPTTTVAPQALWLMNNPHVRSWAAAFGRQLDPGPGRPWSEAVTAAYARALNRVPTVEEQASAVEFLGTQHERHRAAGVDDARGLALTDFAQVVLSLNEFIYAD